MDGDGVERRTGDERRLPGGSGRLPSMLELVEQAAHEAAQEVGQIHRRRLVVQSFLAALLVALVVVIPVALYSNAQREIDSRSNATYNCRTLKNVADIMASFVKSDANLRYQQQHYAQRAQVMEAFGKILPTKTLQEITAESDKADTQTQAFWTQNLKPRLEHLADANCGLAIR